MCKDRDHAGSFATILALFGPLWRVQFLFLDFTHLVYVTGSYDFNEKVLFCVLILTVCAKCIIHHDVGSKNIVDRHQTLKYLFRSILSLISNETFMASDRF